MARSDAGAVADGPAVGRPGDLRDRRAATVPTGSVASTARRRFHLSDTPWIWLAPLIAMLAVFAFYPLFYNIWLSFQEFVPRQRTLEYVGTANWSAMFADSRMWEALQVTLFYTAVCLIIQVALGMSIALLLDDDRRGFGVLRGILTLTIVIPPAITGMMFLLLQDAQFGLIPYVLKSLGIMAANGAILSNPRLALLGRRSRRCLAMDAVHGADLHGRAPRPARASRSRAR